MLIIAACGDVHDGAPEASVGDGASSDVRELSASCVPSAETQCEGWLAMTRADSWTNGDASEDPLLAHRPDPVRCDIAGFRVENGLLELDTGRCNYFWLRQPSLTAVSEGEALTIELRHYDLTSVEPAEAHVALLFDGHVQWETEVRIPAQADVMHVDVSAARALSAGDEVGLHLHNHGQNTWVFGGLWVKRETP